MIALALLGVAISLPAQSRQIQAERLAVLPFVNTTGVEEWDRIAEYMADTIRLTLQLSGQFDVLQLPPGTSVDPYAPAAPAELGRLARAQRIDAAVVGRISPAANDRVELEAAVYAAQSASIVGGQTREAFGSFDILDAADELIVLAASALLGYTVDFGGLILEPSRQDVPYRVYVDNVPVGENLRALPQVLVGRRLVEIAVVGAGGREQYVYSADRLVRSGEALEVRFGLPEVTAIEREEVTVRHEVARALIGRPENYPLAQDALAAARDLLGSGEASEQRHAEQRRLEDIWELEEEFVAFAGAGAGEGILSSYVPGNPLRMIPVSAAMLTTPGSVADGVQERIIRNGAALYHLLRLMWIGSIERAERERAEAIFSDMNLLRSEMDLPIDESFISDRAAYRAATARFEVLEQRRRRPWPWLTLLAGLGGGGYSGYIAFQGPDAGLPGSQFIASDPLYQWGSIGIAGAISLVSGLRIYANLTAGAGYLREWVRQTYPVELSVANRLFDSRASFDEDVATVLVLGSGQQLVDVEGSPRATPVFIESEIDRSLPLAAPYLVAADRERLYSGGLSFVVVR